MAHLGLSADFWAGRRVLVTGHTGFKGGWLSLWLQALGAEVHGFALAPITQPAIFDVAKVAGGMMSHRLGDLRDADAVKDALLDARPDIVFHLAAQPLVRESYRDPIGTLATNIMGSAHLFEAVRQTPGVRALLVVTSDKCYQNREWPWPYRENEALGGHDPYSASKACQEILTAAWRDSFLGETVAVASARAGNVIGGGDWSADRLIPDTLRAWDAGQALELRYPQAVRPWQYHLDALAGYLMLGAELLSGRGRGAWNFGPADTDTLSVEALLQCFAEHWGDNPGWRCQPAPRPHEAGMLRLDSSKARQELGWRSRYGVAASLAAIAAWHRAWQNGTDMRAFSLQQIDVYQNTTQ